ncbi:MAG TPA: hypothetical protein VH144_03075 [Candidatus Saccharimonadales bacterium]|jgi:hypothetical protein|nr:hypothetical protein [Candidatus Saccharimonadales bacterium]
MEKIKKGSNKTIPRKEEGEARKLLGIILIVLPFALAIFVDIPKLIGQQFSPATPSSVSWIPVVVIACTLALGLTLMTYDRQDDWSVRIIKIVPVFVLTLGAYFVLSFIVGYTS